MGYPITDDMTLKGEFVGYGGEIVRWSQLGDIARRDKRVQDEIDRLTLEMGEFERQQGNRLSAPLAAIERQTWLRTNTGARKRV